MVCRTPPMAPVMRSGKDSSSAASSASAGTPSAAASLRALHAHTRSGLTGVRVPKKSKTTADAPSVSPVTTPFSVTRARIRTSGRDAAGWSAPATRVTFEALNGRYRALEGRTVMNRADLITAAMSRALRLGPARNRITIERGVQVPMRDGTILIADHYVPMVSRPRPTVLIRCPYGRGPQFAVGAWSLAEHGYHVLLQSCRGTFGSGGRFTPAVDEAADGQDTVIWLRDQPWFNGCLTLVGQSYLAFTAWALAADPPPELTAMALHISPHDLAAAGFGHGPFELFNLLSWSDLMAAQEQLGGVRMVWRTLTAERRLAMAMNRLPIAATGAELATAGVPWYQDWLGHPDRTDSFWDSFSAATALDRVTAPTLLVTGFHDFFVEQTIGQYQALRRRGVPTALTIGPWTHMSLDLGVALRETIAWFDAYADGNDRNGAVAPSRPSPVRVRTSGLDRWRDLADWPPAGTRDLSLYLQAGRKLAAAADWHDGGAVSTTLHYDPADPTPSVGGRTMSVR